MEEPRPRRFEVGFFGATVVGASAAGPADSPWISPRVDSFSFSFEDFDAIVVHVDGVTKV